MSVTNSMPQIFSLVGSLVAGATVIAVRLRATTKPATMRKIIAPPLGMATGFLMFVSPLVRVPLTWGLAAFLIGALFFSYPLILTSRFEVANGHIYLKRSKMFIVIIVALLAVRILLHDVVERYVSIPQTAGLFFLLAFGMLLPWRLVMVKRFKAVERQMLKQPEA
ncbi:CcdC family protein [Cohnella nanjingensis]|uniref:Cytochrome c biogenesis protein CcdC n=1 Tax=Cohnella nanjingensis TaxID=1387779 RepID=A0A7X0RLT9_9BACL|nr:cytochrome c biogenesis protein CcdC [Cohnella nanjingensis]MBB6669899.1 cytochrome c biogenesis protein CcdC [Cohnella nanjingensis]